MDEAYYEDLRTAKRENYAYIYKNSRVDGLYKSVITPMFTQIYHTLLQQLEAGDESAIIFKHHIQFVEEQRGYYHSGVPYRETEKNQIVVDYMASMTDDYFLALYHNLFPSSSLKVDFVPYF